MRRTFTAFFSGVSADALRDGMAAVFNQDAGGARIYVHSVRMFPAASWGTSGVPGKWSLSRTSAQVGGTSVPVSPHAGGSLPSQVSVAMFPDSVTVVDSFRQQCDAINAWWSQAYQKSSRFYGLQGKNGAEFYWTGQGSTLEPIRLAEGEGISITQPSNEKPRRFLFSATFRLSTGETFTTAFNAGTPDMLDGGIFGIFNGVGSGVTIEVLAINIADNGSVEPPIYRLVRVDGYESGGTVIQPIRHRSGGAIPEGILCVAGSFRAAPYGEKTSGVPISWHTTGVATFSLSNQHSVGTVRRWALGPLNPSVNYQADNSLLYQARIGSDGIVLNPGAGIAVVQQSEARNDSSYAYANIEIQFSYEPQIGVSIGRVSGGI